MTVLLQILVTRISQAVSHKNQNFSVENKRMGNSFYYQELQAGCLWYFYLVFNKPIGGKETCSMHKSNLLRGWDEGFLRRGGGYRFSCFSQLKYGGGLNDIPGTWYGWKNEKLWSRYGSYMVKKSKYISYGVIIFSVKICPERDIWSEKGIYFFQRLVHISM